MKLTKVLCVSLVLSVLTSLVGSKAIALGKNAKTDLNGLKYAFQQAKIVDNLLNDGRFDWDNLQHYDKKPVNDLSILSIWQAYREYKKQFISINTYNIEYESTEAHIRNINDKGLKNPEEIKHFLLDNLTLNVAKKCLMYLKSAYGYAVEQGKVSVNPFKDVEIRLKTSKKDAWDINPFTAEERDLIVEYFKKHPVYNHYTNLVKFLFFTGCRPSEAIALQAKHIFEDHILFEQKLTRDKEEKIEKGLKRQKFRRFPINHQLKQILTDVGAYSKSKNDFLFLHKSGKLINFDYFSQKIWKQKILEEMVEKGLIKSYRKVYQCRHTFITLCLERGIEVKDVAAWVGNTPAMIYKHYAGVNRSLQVPIL
jgi:integrase